MSRENVDLALLMCELFNRRDLDRFLALMHDEVEIESRLVAMEGAYHGHEGVREFFRVFMDPWERISLVAEEFIESGDLVVALGHFHAKGRNSGLEIDGPFGQVLTMRQGRVVRLRGFPDHAQALEAVGLRSSDRKLS